MAKQVLYNIFEDQELNGVTVEVLVGHVIRATPNSGGAEYIRQHIKDEANYLWAGNLDDVDETTETDHVNWEVE